MSRVAPAVSRNGVLWSAGLVGTLIVVGLLPLAWDPRFYWSGDDQAAYFGWWFHLGEQVRSGHWPLLDVQSWRGGNFVAEGQWGLFSPLTILIGMLVSAAPNVLVVDAAVKIVLLVVSGLGVYLVTRSYRVPPAAAFVAGLVAPLCGQSQYSDWSSWVNGLMVTALLPWAWWGLRRLMYRSANPLPALLTCYLLVTVGYVYGTLYLCVVMLGCLLECLLLREVKALLRVLLVGVFCALVAVTVYLPGVLTSPVTVRGAWQFVGEGKWTVDLDTLFTSVLPISLVQSIGQPLPYRYLAWLLPLLAWVDLGRVRSQLRELSSLLLVTAVMLLWVIGPDQMGPIRWPIRVLPALGLPLVVLVVVLLARTLHRQPSWLRLVLSVAWTSLAWWIVTARMADIRVSVSLGALVTALGLVLCWLALRWRGAGSAAVTAAVCTIAVLGVQHHYAPESPSPDRNMPVLAADYRNALSAAEGDTMAVGRPEASWRTDPETADEILIGSTWFLNPHPVHNTGTAISFRAYTERFCRSKACGQVVPLHIMQNRSV